MNNNKDEGWVLELIDETQIVREWMEKHEDNPFVLNRLCRLIPILISAVIDLEKRVLELEEK